jgi:hypothetical protein
MLAGEPIRLRSRTKVVASGSTLLLSLGARRARLRSDGDHARAFINLLADGGSPEAIHHAMAQRFGPQAGRRAHYWTTQLLDRGFLEQTTVPHDLDPLDVARFDRLLHYFSEYEHGDQSRFDYLQRLRASMVVVIGVGGLGSWIIFNLLSCGIGSLRLVDSDRVEASNLNRSILFTEDDVGMSKTTAAARSVLRYAPRTEIECVETHVDGPACVSDLLRGADLVISTIDKPPWSVRLWVTEACASAGLPNLQASSRRVGPFSIPGRSSCTMCDWLQLNDRVPGAAEIIAAQAALPLGTTGSLSPMASIGAGVAALDAVRLLTGVSPPLTLGRIWELNDDLSTSLTPIPMRPDCPYCQGSRDVPGE